MAFTDVLTRLFKHEEINGHGRCPTYLHRWTLFQPKRPKVVWGGFGIYLHKFVGDDWSKDLHDHPKRFISIGLAGTYVEQTPARDVIRRLYHDVTLVSERQYTAPWIRTFPAHHVHRIRLLVSRRPCWTLVIVLRHVREWGFWHRERFIPWREYVAPDNRIADERRACP